MVTLCPPEAGNLPPPLYRLIHPKNQLVIILGPLSDRHSPWSLPPTLQMKGRWESNINIWFPFMYSQKWNCYFQNRITVKCSVSQFLHSYTCERFIYFQDRSAAGKYLDRSWEYINRSQTHECGSWDWVRAIPRKWIHKWDFPRSAWFLLWVLHFHLLIFGENIYTTLLKILCSTILHKPCINHAPEPGKIWSLGDYSTEINSTTRESNATVNVTSTKAPSKFIVRSWIRLQ